jgi:hypothetical protein
VEDQTKPGKRVPRIGDRVHLPRGVNTIASVTQGVVFLQGRFSVPIPLENLKPSPDGRENVWVLDVSA